MEFVIDPPIAAKIAQMGQRVRWGESSLQQRQIDQTRLVLEDGQPDQPEFSFLVLGDSGSGPHRGHNPQRQIAERMLEHRDDCRFILHTGDVIYLTGASEYYLKNFIEPYRELIVGGDRPRQVPYDQMVFKLPFLPVPGNHDYYDLPLLYGILAQITLPLRRLLESQLDLDIGLRGSVQGNAYARAFLDYLKALKPAELERHLDRHYTAQTDTGRCLSYRPGEFTRLPNRYYWFRSGGIDFFALDSNTFNAPMPLPETQEGNRHRQHLIEQQADIERQMAEISQQSSLLNPQNPSEAEQLDDLQAKLEQLAEIQKDIDKQLNCTHETTTTDAEQLAWLQNRLIASWQNSAVRGRVLFFHHPPYVTEATKWHQAQTIAVRGRLQQVLDAVAKQVGDLVQGQPIVDLVLNGHAHCMEYLRTLDTGHADSHMNWIVCGGSGYSLRRQREEGSELPEFVTITKESKGRTIAKSHLFVGRNGQGSYKRRPYSFLRVTVKDGRPPKFIVQPFVSERYLRQWHDYELDAIVL
jgi:3',5'-cyclic AMP phosphodiesterase CpdA